VVQLAVALGAQWMDRSVLDAGLAVLSFASGAVLGAFLLGTLVPDVDESSAFIGMLVGLIIMTIVWGWTTIAFTWYVFIGAATTCAVAWVLSRFSRGAQGAQDRLA
jgi:Na+/proline symporter